MCGGGSLFGRWGTLIKHKVAGIDIPKAPYNFAVQAGDPVLRQKAQEVNPEDIKTPEIQLVISRLISVMRRNRSYGLAAPQIGVPLRLFATELSRKEAEYFTEDDRRTQAIMPWSCMVFINPKMTIEDSSKTTFKEACLSIQGYAANVPRALKVKVEGLDSDGDPHSWTVSHFGARVVQHEMDHLNGKLFTDSMDPQTFHFMLWKYVQQMPNSRKAFGGE